MDAERRVWDALPPADEAPLSPAQVTHWRLVLMVELVELLYQDLAPQSPAAGHACVVTALMLGHLRARLVQDGLVAEDPY